MASVRADVKKRLSEMPIKIILDDLDLSWTMEEMEQAVMMWNSGYSIGYMAGMLRSLDHEGDATDETALLVMHLRRQGVINNRQGGYEGFSDICKKAGVII